MLFLKGGGPGDHDPVDGATSNVVFFSIPDRTVATRVVAGSSPSCTPSRTSSCSHSRSSLASGPARAPVRAASQPWQNTPKSTDWNRTCTSGKLFLAVSSPRFGEAFALSWVASTVANSMLRRHVLRQIGWLGDGHMGWLSLNGMVLKYSVIWIFC